MRLLISALLLFPGLLQGAGASPLIPRYGDFVVHEKRNLHPEVQAARRLEGHVTVPLRIALKQKNLEYLPDYLMSVSNPSSVSYGEHWSHEKVVKHFAPSPDAHDTVRSWLMDAGFDPARMRLSHNKAWIEVPGATALEVEDLLNTQFHIFEHDGEEHVACHEYSLPAGVAEHVDFVTPTVQGNVKLVKAANHFPPQSNSLKKRAVAQTLSSTPSNNTTDGSLAGCDTAVVPSCLKTLYNITYTPKATALNTFGIVSDWPDTYLQSDLDTFFRNFSPSLVGTSPTLVSINGGSIELDPSSDVGEDGWILQYAMSLVQPQPVQFLQMNNPQIGEVFSFNEWLDAVDGSYCTSEGGDDFTYDPQLPNPLPGGFKDHSCGTVKAPNVVSNSQAFHEYQFSDFYKNRQCNEFAKLGLMGVTIFGYCLDGNGSENLNATHFNPAWPATCPWITVVGGTQVKANASASGGGGFSNTFARPAYQERRSTSISSSWRRATLRTSGATPTVAAIITLVNDARIAAGKKPVGFINPTIYSTAFETAFNDIVDGTSQGCKGRKTAGWDAATGVGTPNLGKLIEKWLELP
ncbi:Pro-kumamolisin, activation domain-containing protein [Gymnopilus junonius]|uniref:Pro-kumamolisin, activation domain-containing protein n=1 Tax=Gymnopilus junonius TaxID=109634 RepID=A0A9P5TQG3_GYMJU|nr:Pro-kumamolisin, activation domain-containing protein [Gymnopilus junonius]